ncbi:hypothetical protein OPV22_002546 [Ensete ventricosum]|uniref:Uncharacterized protein n=1 Tax=Ensete ventricosum TaxID=4639 RepID=A0AAV8RY48_ENSVE|nr:hypothetical protein OPV22_002546 [Ensete ventricosum]
MGLSYSREGAARRFVRSPPLAARSGGPKRPVLACFWAVFACCGGRGERSSGRGIRVAGKVLPFASFAVRRSPLARAAKNGQFWPVFGPFSRAVATAASGAKRQPSQHPGTPRVAQGWMGLSYSREGVARRFVFSPPLAARSGGPKRPVLACFWAVFVCCGGARCAVVWTWQSCSREGAALRFVRRPSLAARSGGQKRPVLACFWAVFGVPRPPRRAVRNVSHLSTLEPPGWHRAGWGFRVAGKVPPVASFALRRSPLARAAQNGQEGVLPFASFAVRRSPLARAAKNGQFWPVFGPFFACRGDRGERCETSAISAPWNPPGWHRAGWGFRIAGKVPPVASFALRRSPLARAAQNGQFWPVFGPFSCAVVGRGERSSGRGSRVAGKVLPSASFAVRRWPLALAAKNGQFWPVFGPFFRVPRRPRRAVRNVSHLSTLEPPGWHRAGWGFRIAGKVPPVASFALRRSPLARAAQNGQFWPVFGPFSRAAVGAVSGRLDVAVV